MHPTPYWAATFVSENCIHFTKEIGTNGKIFKLVLLGVDFLKEKMEKLTLKVTEVSGGHRNKFNGALLSDPAETVLGTGYFP